jgi:hypothetical protein
MNPLAYLLGNLSLSAGLLWKPDEPHGGRVDIPDFGISLGVDSEPHSVWPEVKHIMLDLSDPFSKMILALYFQAKGQVC